GIGSNLIDLSCPRKRASRAMNWIPACAGTSGFVVAALALLAFAAPAAAQFGPPELIEAAKQEGRLVFYSANVAESEKPILDAFNKRFPFVKIEFLRAPGNQLLQRVKTEAAAG